MQELPAYPVWSGDPLMEPQNPSHAYFWDGTEWLLILPYLNKLGQEVLDSTPMEPPIGYIDQPDLYDQIRAMVRSAQLAEEAARAGHESFEEADDFEVGDDFDPETPYENDFDPDYKTIVADVEAANKTPGGAATASGPPRGGGAPPASSEDQNDPPHPEPSAAP